MWLSWRARDFSMLYGDPAAAFISIHTPYPAAMAPLHDAVEMSREDEVKWLIQEDPKRLWEADYFQRMPAHRTACPRIAAILMDYAPSTGSMCDCFGRIPLHYAPSADMVGAWIRGGCDPLTADGYGFTPLHLAAQRGYAEVSAELVRLAPESLRARDAQGRLPVDDAAKYGHMDTLRVLVEADAGVDIAPALELAAAGDHVDIVMYLDSIDPTACARGSPLHMASSSGAAHSLSYLLSKLSPNTLDSRGCLPLHHAALFGHPECIGMLVDAGTSCVAQDTAGRLPLHYAALGGSVECVDLLLASGGIQTATQRDADDGVALHFAAEGSSAGMVTHLMSICPEASQMKNVLGEVPLDAAIRCTRDDVIEAMMTAYEQLNLPYQSTETVTATFTAWVPVPLKP
jgi:ankyrin repeat protein